MEKREKVLLAVMLIGLLFVGPYYFLSGGKKVPTVADLVNKESLDKAIKEVDTISKRDVLSKVEITRLQRAEAPWPFNPFYDRNMDVEKDQDVILQIPDGVRIDYTGYVSVNGEMYAIVSSMEYQVGDHLEIAGAENFMITHIYKNKIIVGKLDNNDKMVGELEIGINDDESF